MDSDSKAELQRVRFLQTVRVSSLAEGVSYLLLLFVAMPLKYLADLPIAVSIVGSLHGALFVVLALALLASALGWSLKAQVMIASLVPFGAFFMDRRLRAVHASSD